MGRNRLYRHPRVLHQYVECTRHSVQQLNESRVFIKGKKSPKTKRGIEIVVSRYETFARIDESVDLLAKDLKRKFAKLQNPEM